MKNLYIILLILVCTKCDAQNNFDERFLAQEKLVSELHYLIHEVESIQLSYPLFPLDSKTSFIYFLYISHWDIATNTFEYSIGPVLNQHAFTNQKPVRYVYQYEGRLVYISLSSEISSELFDLEYCPFELLSQRELSSLENQNRKPSFLFYSGKSLIYFIKENPEKKSMVRYNQISDVPVNRRSKSFYTEKFLQQLLIAEEDAEE